eukprot:998555_1
MAGILFILSVLSVRFVHSGPFQANWSTTIVDPQRPNHKIPIEVSYPVSGGPYPVIIFAHGWEGRVRWYDYIYDSMVPHGYVVGLPASEENLGASGTTLAKDQRYLLDYLVEQNNNRSSPVYNKIASKGYFASGHSMGGEATILSGSNYNLGETFKNEFDGMMTLSACGGNTEKNALKSMTKPAFIMSGSSDCTCNPKTASIPFYNILNSNSNDPCKYLAIIKDGIHCFFCDFDYDYAPQARVDECLIMMHPCGDKLEMKVQIGIINRYMKMFMDAVISGDSNGYKNVTDTLQSDLASGVMSQIAANCTL